MSVRFGWCARNLIVLAGLALAACGSSSKPNAASSTSSAPAPTSSASTTTTTSAATPPPDSVTGDYDVTYATPGSVTVHVTADGKYTISVKTPFKMVGATCNLATSAVIATFSGTSPSFKGTASFYDPSTCAFASATDLYDVRLNTDGTLTSTYLAGTGPHSGESHVFTKTAPGKTSSRAISGKYSVTYATAGAVSVSGSAENYTIAVSTPFKFYGAACDVAATSVIATFSGTPPSFTGTASFYDLKTCAFASSSKLYQVRLNTDGTLTSTYLPGNGPHSGESHLLTPT